MTNAPRGLGGVDVVVLAGGLGTRLRGVLTDRPKVLAPICGEPFLNHLARGLSRQGASRLILCLGHLAGAVIDHAATRPVAGVEFVPVVEQEPLGTAGAVRLARPAVTSDPALVLNGDSLVVADLAGFADRHRAAGVEASLLAVRVEDTTRFGRLDVNAAGFIERFSEKNPDACGPGLISAGIYLFSAALLDRLLLMPGPSLERDVLQVLPAGSIRAEITGGAFIDIGTPDSLAQAGIILPGDRE